MSERGERLATSYLVAITELSRTTRLNKKQIGAKALATFLKCVVDECDTLTYKATQELYQIAQEVEDV
tara:strand:- start:2013 stop:2216 length:204 start_codon:yes stop_codon:yes gene_type:complete